MTVYDCIVVGGGPIGGYVAQEIAEKNFTVGIIEEHKEIGLPIRCAGLVSSQVLDFVKGFQDKFNVLSIKGAHIHSPSNKIYTIGGDKPHAYVINRHVFDKKIINKAENTGAELLLGTKVVSLRKNTYIECTCLQNKHKKKLHGKLIVGADGPNSIVRRSSNLPSPLEYIRCIGADVSNISIDPQYVEIYFDTKIAPGFFAWVIPSNDKGTAARIGLGVVQEFSGRLKTCFKDFISNSIFDDAIVNSHIGGSIPLGGLSRTTQSNVMVVGDAAAQVKPTSGGGLYPGLTCGKYCASTAVDALLANRLDDKFLRNYHFMWTKDIGKELTKGLFYRRIFLRFSNKEFEKALKILDNPKILDCINSYGDIDYPSRLVVPVIKSMPILLRAIPGFLIK